MPAAQECGWGWDPQGGAQEQAWQVGLLILPVNHTGHPLLMGSMEAEIRSFPPPSSKTSHPQLATTWLEQGNRSTPNHLPPMPSLTSMPRS